MLIVSEYRRDKKQIAKKVKKIAILREGRDNMATINPFLKFTLYTQYMTLFDSVDQSV